MGYGDDLLITSFAAQLKKQFPERQIVIGNVSKRQAFHSIIYENNPNIADCNKLDSKKPIHIIDYHTGNRPYIDYNRSNNKKYIWNKKFKVKPGEIYFSDSEKLKAKKIIDDAIEFWKSKNKHSFKAIIFFEPSSTKIDTRQFGTKQLNKDWGINNWKELALKLQKNYLLIQSMHAKSKIIEGIYASENLNFRCACAVLNECDFYVGLEGGFVQAAGALKKNGVIYYGGWIDPKIIGYDFHVNIYYENSKSPCGEYGEICSHCEEARRSITCDLFFKEINELAQNLNYT